MTQEVDRMVFRLAYRMALVDGELSSNEAVLLEVLAKELALGASEVASLGAESERIDYDSLRRVFPERAHQLRLFETAALLAMADGRSDLEEWRLATRLTQALRMDRAEVEACLAGARDRLRKLSREHELAPELRANLERQGLGG
ncbi:MAG: hypothetical protein RBU30_07655 [Polyangia bacterium]|jgi:hypothetical protein|nr:hypothetical protein [Polyangia bacterium]